MGVFVFGSTRYLSMWSKLTPRSLALSQDFRKFEGKSQLAAHQEFVPKMAGLERERKVVIAARLRLATPGARGARVPDTATCGDPGYPWFIGDLSTRRAHTRHLPVKP